MNNLQQLYAIFMENICRTHECNEMYPALLEGFAAYCKHNSLFEATLTDYCEECGHKIDDPHSCYCENCGAKLDDDLDVGDEKAAKEWLLDNDPNPDKICKKCGAPVDMHDKYCSACGEKCTDKATTSINKQTLEVFIDFAKDAFKPFGQDGFTYGLKNNMFIAKIPYSSLFKAIKDANDGKDFEGFDKELYVSGIHKAINKIQNAVKDSGINVKLIDNDVYLTIPVKNFENKSLPNKIITALLDGTNQAMIAAMGVAQAKWNKKTNYVVSDDEKEDYDRFKRASAYVDKLIARAKESKKHEDVEAAQKAREQLLSMKKELMQKYVNRRSAHNERDIQN